MKRIVKQPFDFYHDGINPTHYPAGEQDIPKDALAVAEAEGWLEEADQKPSGDPPAFTAKHLGGGKWDVVGPEGVVASDLNKDEAKAKAAELNAPGNEEE